MLFSLTLRLLCLLLVFSFGSGVERINGGCIVFVDNVALRFERVS